MCSCCVFVVVWLCLVFAAFSVSDPALLSSSPDVALLHRKITHLKETGGACWLRHLNDLLQSESHTPLDQAAKTSCGLPVESPRPNVVGRGSESTSFPLGHLKRIQRKARDSETVSKADGEPNRKAKKPANIMLPETLPSATDGAVCSYIQSLLPSRSQKGPDSDQFQELPIHIMWATVIVHHTKQDVEFPGCVFITTENLHVFSVRSLAGDTGIPELSRTIRLPLEKVTQITIGYESLYVQLEWSSTEQRTQGLVVFLTFSHGKTNALINAIKLARRRSIPELDEYEDPHIVAGSGLEASLKQALNSYERCLDPFEGVQILLYLLVMVEGNSPETVKTSSLVVTSRYIYLINQDYCNTPQSSFTKDLPSSPVFEVVSIFPVSSRLVNIQMYDVDTIESSSYHSLWSTFGKTSAGGGGGLSVGFIGYGVRMSFHLGEYGIQVFDVRTPTSNQREKFLKTLVQVHASISDVLARSSFQKVKAHSPLRDADSLSCGSSGSQRSSSRPKDKRNKKRSTEVSNFTTQATQKSSVRTSHDKNQIVDKTASELNATGDPNRGNSEALNGVTTAEINSTVSCAIDLNFESPVKSERDRLVLAETSTELIDSTAAIQPDLIESNPSVSSIDNEPLAAITNDGKNQEKNFTTNHLTPSDLSEVCDEIKQNVLNVNDILRASEILQDSGSTRELNKDRLIRKKSLSSASSSSEEDAEEDSFRRGHSEDNPIVEDTQFVSDNDIAIIRLAVGEVGSTNQIPSTNGASKIPSMHLGLGKMSLLPGKERGKSFSNIPELPLQFGYPSSELLLHLTESFQSVPQFPPVSPQFEAFMSLNGLELVNYFHQNIAVISTENEELNHIVWSPVVPYKNPSLEIPSCVLLSTKAIYIVSDHYDRKQAPVSLQRSHKRYFSDTSPLQPNLRGEFDERSSKRSPSHLSCGILNNSTCSEQKRVFRVYTTVLLKDLKQVNIGIFSQSIRLTGLDEDNVLSCVTRDCQRSETFLRKLKTILVNFYPLPSPETNMQDLEQDFYSMFSKSRSTESKLTDDCRFVYPFDDYITDIIYLIGQSLKGDTASAKAIRLLSYLLCFQIDSTVTSESPCQSLRGKPRTLILTEEHLVLAVEDHVSYPLPDFARMPPARPQMEITEVRCLKFLREIALRSDDATSVVLVFSDETGELVVDTSVEHFGSDKEQTPTTLQTVQEIRWTLLIQNGKDIDKLIRLISHQWEEQNGGKQLTIITLP